MYSLRVPVLAKYLLNGAPSKLGFVNCVFDRGIVPNPTLPRSQNEPGDCPISPVNFLALVTIGRPGNFSFDNIGDVFPRFPRKKIVLSQVERQTFTIAYIAGVEERRPAHCRNK